MPKQITYVRSGISIPWWVPIRILLLLLDDAIGSAGRGSIVRVGISLIFGISARFLDAHSSKRFIDRCLTHTRRPSNRTLKKREIKKKEKKSAFLKVEHYYLIEAMDWVRIFSDPTAPLSNRPKGRSCLKNDLTLFSYKTMPIFLTRQIFISKLFMSCIMFEKSFWRRK